MVDKCPSCGRYGLEFDPFGKRARCLYTLNCLHCTPCASREQYDEEVKNRRRMDDHVRLCTALRLDADADIDAIADAADDLRAAVERLQDDVIAASKAALTIETVEIRRLREILQRFHDKADDFNAAGLTIDEDDDGPPPFCLFCRSYTYDVVDGIVHADDCVILAARAAGKE